MCLIFGGTSVNKKYPSMRNFPTLYVLFLLGIFMNGDNKMINDHFRFFLLWLSLTCKNRTQGRFLLDPIQSRAALIHSFIHSFILDLPTSNRQPQTLWTVDNQHAQPHNHIIALWSNCVNCRKRLYWYFLLLSLVASGVGLLLRTQKHY